MLPHKRHRNRGRNPTEGARVGADIDVVPGARVGEGSLWECGLEAEREAVMWWGTYAADCRGHCGVRGGGMLGPEV